MAKNTIIHNVFPTYTSIPKTRVFKMKKYPKENWDDHGYSIINDDKTDDNSHMDDSLPGVNKCASFCLCMTLITVCGGVVYIVLSVMDNTINDTFINSTNITN